MSFFKKLTLLSAMSISILSAPVHAEYVNIYSTNFSNNWTYLHSGVTETLLGGELMSSQGFGLYGFGGNMYAMSVNSVDNSELLIPGFTSVLEFTLNNMPQHDKISIGGLLGLINSWDGDNDSQFQDYLSVYLDDQLLHTTTFGLFNPTISNFGTRLTPAEGEALVEIGSHASWREQAYDFNGLTLLSNINHSNSQATIKFVAHGNGWQGGLDESFGLGALNVSVSNSASNPPANVHEPVTGYFVALFLLMLGLKNRRKV